MPTDPAALKAALAPHGLAFVSGWYSLNLLARSVEDEKRAIQPHLDLLKAMGCQVVIACETSNAIHGHDDRPLVDGPVLALRRLGEVRRRRRGHRRLHRRPGPHPRLPPPHGHDRRVPARDRPFHGRHRPGDKAPPRHRPLPLRRRRPHRAGAQIHAPRRPHPRQERPPAHRPAGRDRAPLLPRRRPPRRLHRPRRPRGRRRLPPVLEVAAQHGYAGWLVIEAEQDPAVRSPLLYQGMGLTALKAMARSAGLDP